MKAAEEQEGKGIMSALRGNHIRGDAHDLELTILLPCRNEGETLETTLDIHALAFASQRRVRRDRLGLVQSYRDLVR